MPQIIPEVIADFSGGLNLRPDAFKLAPNESPDLVNVDLSDRGGIQLRAGTAPLHDFDVDGQIIGVHGYTPDNGTPRILVQTDGGWIAYLDTSLPFDWWYVEVPAGGGVDLNIGSAIARSVTFKNRMYIQNGSVNAVKWTGGTAATAVLDSAMGWNDNLESPTPENSNGKMPRARFITSWMGCVWIAGVHEGPTFYGNRVRWSHPNFPEDWHSLHYIDIDTGSDGDQITGLVPFGDRLLVFKRSSIHVIQGAPPESLTTHPLGFEAGALSQDAIVSTDLGVYFFDPIEGVFLIRSNGQIEWQFEKIYPAIKDGRISALTIDKVRLGWGNRRLWVAIPFESSVDRNDVFVLDPSLGGRRSPGAWVRYTRMPVGPFLEWAPQGQKYQFLAAAGFGVNELDRHDLVEDSYIIWDPEYNNVPIPSRFRTAWIDLGQPAVEKRWKRPEIVMKAGTDATIDVEAFANYNAGFPRRRFSITAKGFGGFLTWGSGSPENKWGSNRWAPDGDRLNEIERGSPLGTARSVSLLFKGPLNRDWGINQVTLKFIPRKVKG